MALESLVHPNVEGLERALREGCTLHGFRSGGGLRVIRIKKEESLRGYGEHPNVEEALAHANEDFLAGGREYKEVYGKTKTHYWTGSQDATSPLDDWLLQGRDIDAYVKDGEVVVELRGLAQTEIPEEVCAKVTQTGQPVRWSQRGYTFCSESSTLPSGKPCVSTSVVESPLGQKRGGPWSYHIVQTGTAKGFFAAFENAYKATPQEVER